MVRVELDDQTDFDAANQHTQKALHQIVSLNNDNFAIEQIIDFCRATTGANIAVNWPALELVGIDQDSLVSISLTNVPVSKLLELTLAQVSADAFDDDKAGYIIHDGIVMISTLRDLRGYQETLIYDVSWLLDERDKLIALLYRDHEHAEELNAMFKQGGWFAKPAPVFDLDLALSGTNSGGTLNPNDGDNKNGLFADDVENSNRESFYVLSREERIDVVMDLIQTTVGDIDDWIDGEYRMRELKQKLIITTTRSNHLQIEALLAAMREAQVAHFERKARQIEVFLLLKDAEASRLAQRYTSAMRKINQALRVDPGSAEAHALRAIIEQTRSR